MSERVGMAGAGAAGAVPRYDPADFVFTEAGDDWDESARRRPTARGVHGATTAAAAAAAAAAGAGAPATATFVPIWTKASINGYAEASHLAQLDASGPAGAASAASAKGPTGAPADRAGSASSEYPHPLQVGIYVNPEITRMGIQDTSGVPGSFVDDDAPFGKNWALYELEKKLLFYLEPFTLIASEVAGLGDGDISKMLNEEFTKSSGISSLISMSNGPLESIVGQAQNVIRRNPGTPAVGTGAAGAGSGSGGASSTASVGGAAAQTRNAVNARGIPRPTERDMSHMRTEWDALMYLWKDRTTKPPTKDEFDQIHRMFSSQVNHSFSHTNSPTQLGAMCLNDRFRAGLSQALLLLSVEWRQDLEAHFDDLNNLVRPKLVRAFFAKVIFTITNDIKFFSGKARLAQGTFVKNKHTNFEVLRRMSQRLRWNGSTNALEFGPEVERGPRDYHEMYRRR